MKLADLREAATANFVVHAARAASRVGGMRVESTDALTVIDSGLPADSFNIVCSARLGVDEVALRAAAVARDFATVERPYSWWVAPGDEPQDLAERLEACGMIHSETELAMALELAAVGARRPSVPDLEVEPVASLESLRVLAGVLAENWTPPDPSVGRFYEKLGPGLLAADSSQRFYLGRLGGVIAAAVEVTVGGGVAGIYNLSTRPAFRKRGLGGAMLSAALDEARALGISTAVLQAAEAGVSLYRREGFEQFGEIRELKPGPVRSVR